MFPMFQDKSGMHRYEKLESENNLESEDLSEPPIPLSSSKRRWLWPIVVLLILSNICTWFISQWRFRSEGSSFDDSRSLFASLPRDSPVAMGTQSVYVDKNVTLRNAAWEAINIDAGMIAIPDDFVAEHGLPAAQRFVWDKSKSVYLLNGYHTLHCARAVYISLMEFWEDKPQSRHWEHVIHCVDHLRQEAVCNADDTPRYSTDDDAPISGYGQVRMCRSWDALEEWARGHTACYRYINQTASFKDFPQIERFVWCPEDTPYAAEVEKVFGKINWADYPS